MEFLKCSESENDKCLPIWIENLNVEIFNNVVSTKDVYMHPSETQNMGSFDISDDGVKVKHKVPNHEMKGFKIIILPCMSSDFNILKLSPLDIFWTKYSNHNLYFIFYKQIFKIH